MTACVLFKVLDCTNVIRMLVTEHSNADVTIATAN